MTHGDPKIGGRHGDEGLRIGREGLKPVYDFINSCGETPYFLWYAPMMPHLPHDPPKRLFSPNTCRRAAPWPSPELLRDVRMVRRAVWRAARFFR